MLPLSPLQAKEPFEVVSRIKRGLCGYVSYLAACEMNEAFSEYVLYEPILRLLTASGFEVQCEYECPGASHARRGDKKRLDFYATHPNGIRFGLEVKWLTNTRVSIDSDIEKLTWLWRAEKSTYPLLCLFGRRSLIEKQRLQGSGLKEWGTGTYADLGRTRYGCRLFVLAEAVQ